MQYERLPDERLTDECLPDERTGRTRTGRLAGIFAASAIVIILGSLTFIATDLGIINGRLGHIESLLDTTTRSSSPMEHENLSTTNKVTRSDFLAGFSDPQPHQLDVPSIKSDSLVPHPHYVDTFILPLLRPNNTDSVVSVKEKRYIW